MCGASPKPGEFMMGKLVVDVLNKPINRYNHPITQDFFIYLWPSR